LPHSNYRHSTISSELIIIATKYKYFVYIGVAIWKKKNKFTSFVVQI
jgi:hypothetical protein